jgi:EamA domain-containing membrane protein RarD
MWWDAFLSLEVALLSIVALPAVMLADLPQSSVIEVGVAAILAAIVLAACGVVTAVLIGLRMRRGEDRLPDRLRLPLPSWMRPTLQDRG